MAAGGLAALLLTGSPAEAKRPVPKDNTEFGTRFDGDKLKLHLDQTYSDHGQVSADTTSLIKEGKSDLNVGVRTPVFSDRFRFNTMASYDFKNGRYAFTSFGDIMDPSKDLRVRIGGFRSNKRENGTFAGGRFRNDQFSLEGDFAFDPARKYVNFRGFASALIKDLLYVSAGGKVTEEELNILAGIVSDGSFGAYVTGRYNAGKHSSEGRLVIGDKWKLKKQNYDQLTKVANGTEMQGVATGKVFDAHCINNGLLYDIFASERFTLVAGWSSDDTQKSVYYDAYLRLFNQIYAGLGFSNIRDSRTGQESSFVDASLQGKLSGPIYFQLRAEGNNEKLNAEFALGLSTRL